MNFERKSQGYSFLYAQRKPLLPGGKREFVFCRPVPAPCREQPEVRVHPIIFSISSPFAFASGFATISVQENMEGGGKRRERGRTARKRSGSPPGRAVRSLWYNGEGQKPICPFPLRPVTLRQ